MLFVRAPSCLSDRRWIDQISPAIHVPSWLSRIHRRIGSLFGGAEGFGGRFKGFLHSSTWEWFEQSTQMDGSGLID